MQFQAKDSLKQTLHKTLMVQAVLTLVAAVVALFTKGDQFALALVYGGAVTIAGTWLHAWRLLKISATNREIDPAQVGAEVFKGTILKLGAMVVLLALGMGTFKLNPLAVLIGFIIAYLGFLSARGYAPRSKPGK
ncbi:MAG: ATP synthase subunit I [Gammaproteobacteria bacterium]|jgi:F0F1-type ATP synthase assembly protein I